MIVQATGRPRLIGVRYPEYNTKCRCDGSPCGPLGLYGVLVGTVFGVVVSSAYFLWRFHHVSGISMWGGLGSWLWRLGIAVCVRRDMYPPSTGGSSTELLVDSTPWALVLVLGSALYSVILLVGIRVSGFGAMINAGAVSKVLPTRLAALLKSPIASLAGIRS